MTKFLSILLLPLIVGAVTLPFVKNSQSNASTNITETTSIALDSDNMILLRNEISDDSVSKVQKKVAELVAKRGSGTYTIYLVLDSPGGSIDAGLTLIESLKTVKNLETISLFAASMASGIVEALPVRRNILANSTLMFHRARGGVEGQFENGELESRLEFYKKVVRSMEQNNANRMGMALEAYKAAVVNELWIYGNDNISQNSADRIVTISCSQELISQVVEETFVVMGMFEITVEFSGCPLVKSAKVKQPEQEQRFKQYRQQKKWGI